MREPEEIGTIDGGGATTQRGEEAQKETKKRRAESVSQDNFLYLGRESHLERDSTTFSRTNTYWEHALLHLYFFFSRRCLWYLSDLIPCFVFGRVFDTRSSLDPLSFL